MWSCELGGTAWLIERECYHIEELRAGGCSFTRRFHLQSTLFLADWNWRWVVSLFALFLGGGLGCWLVVYFWCFVGFCSIPTHAS